MGWNAKLSHVNLKELTKIVGNLDVRARPRPCSAYRARNRAQHRAEPPLPLSWRVATHASGK